MKMYYHFAKGQWVNEEWSSAICHYNKDEIMYVEWRKDSWIYYRQYNIDLYDFSDIKMIFKYEWNNKYRMVSSSNG